MENSGEQEKDKKATRKSRWSVGGLSLPSLPGVRSSSQERPTVPATEKTKSNMGAKITFWKRRTANITDYDPTYRVVYLGNVLTGWAKGEGCVDKPLSTLWRNHISSEKADIVMKVTIVGSGLRAVTKEHGLTEYWANRITYCTAHPSYPRVFCWIYRHEGRKMKQELRCHAVLCPKEDKAKQMSSNLSDRLHQALIDFKKEKISRQNARLSLANSIHTNPSMPYRKLLLQAGTSNYKPPIERSKSAPKLTSIEESELEEAEEVNFRVEVIAPDSDSLEAIAEVHPEPCLTSCFSSSSPMLTGRVPHLPSSSPPSFNQHMESAVIIFEADNSDDEDEIKDYIGIGNTGDLMGEADSAASVSPASQGRSGSSLSAGLSADSPSGDPDCHSLSSDHGSLDRMGKITEQDNISDESGYSEEPCSDSKEITVVNVNLGSTETPTSANDFHLNDESSDPEDLEHRLEISVSSSLQDRPPLSITTQSVGWDQPVMVETSEVEDYSSSSGHSSQDTSPRSGSLISDGSSSPEEQRAHNPESPILPIPLLQTEPRDIPLTMSNTTVSTSPRLTDLSVKSVLLSEFTSGEKIRYIERSSIQNTKKTMVLNRQEFCINI